MGVNDSKMRLTADIEEEQYDVQYVYHRDRCRNGYWSADDGEMIMEEAK